MVHMIMLFFKFVSEQETINEAKSLSLQTKDPVPGIDVLAGKIDGK